MTASVSVDDRRLWTAMALIGAVWLSLAWVYRQPAPARADAPPTEFSSRRAQPVLARLLGDGRSHPLGSEADAQLRERIVQALAQMGITPQRQNAVLICGQYGTCATPGNIVARLPGSEPDSGDILLCAHYDSVPAGPGASDNVANVAAVLEIARALQVRGPARHGVVLLLDEGEEAGLLGAQAFVQHDAWAHSIIAAVNLDARGTSGRSLMFETGSNNSWLMKLYAGAIPAPLANSIFYQVYKRLPNDTDFSVFKSAGYQGFNLAYVGDVMRYHTPLDDLRHADLGSMQDQGQAALSLLWALANATPPNAQSSEAAYFDLFGRLLIRAPQGVLLPTAVVSAALTLLLLLRLKRRAELTWPALVWGMGATVAASMAALVAAGTLLSILTRVSPIAPGGLFPFIAHPLALQWCFASLSVTVLAVILNIARRRVNTLSAFAGWASVNALLALVCAMRAPAVSFLWVLPALAACAVLLAWPRPRWRGRTLLLQAALSAVLWLPFTQMLYVGLGTPALLADCVLIMQTLMPISALYLAAGTNARLALLATSAVLTVGSMAIALLQPVYTVESPQRVNVHYLLDPTAQRAHWLVSAESGAIPAAMLAVERFSSDAQPRFPWIRRPMQAASAPLIKQAAPMVSVAALDCAGTAAHYRLHITSAGADTESLYFPPGVQLRSVTYIDGSAQQRQLSVTTLLVGGGWSTLQLYNLRTDGVDLALDAPRAAVSIHVIDTRYGIAAEAALLRARPAYASPFQDGDVTSVWIRQSLPGCTPVS